MPNRLLPEISPLRQTCLLAFCVVAGSLLCLEVSAQESAKQAPVPVTLSLGQKMRLLPLLPESEPRAEYPLTIRAEADEHGLYLVFDLQDVVLSELSRTGSPFYIDLHFDLCNKTEKTGVKRGTRFRLVGRFDEGQMAVERTVSDDKGENLKTESQLDAEARLSFLRSGTPRVSLFLGRKEIGEHPWKIGEAGQAIAFDVYAHFANIDRSETLQLVDDGEDVDGSEKEKLTAEPGEPGQQVYPEWHSFGIVRGLNDPNAHTISTATMNCLLLRKFSLDDLTKSLSAIGKTSAEDDIARRAESVALMTILNAEVRGGLIMAREHQDESVREGAKRVTAAQSFAGLSGGTAAPSSESDTAGQ